MRLGSVVRVTRPTVIIGALLSFSAFSLLLFNRLDYVTLVDEAVQQTRGGMCRCGVADYAPPVDYQLHAWAADGSMATTRGIQAAESTIAEGTISVPFQLRTVQPEVNQAKISLFTHQSRANMSLDDAKRNEDKLSLAAHRMEEERRFPEDADSTAINNNNKNGNDYDEDRHQVANGSTRSTVGQHTGLNMPLVEPVESILQPNGPTAEEKQRSKAISEYFTRLTRDVRLREDIVRLLQQAVAMVIGERRKARPDDEIKSPVVHRSTRRPWKEFDNSITQHSLYRSSPDQGQGTDERRTHYIDRLLKNMASLPVRRIEEMVGRGTQLKLILTLDDGTNVLFKPMRISKDAESNPNHFVFNEMERHHAEIAAFHLDRLFDFRRVPPVAGRYINLTSQIIPFADPHLVKTFFISPVGNICFFGKCKYYCDSHHAVCGNPDIIEGSAAVFLPSDDEQQGPYPRETWSNPWAQIYSKRGQLPSWKTQENFCDEVRTTSPYNSGRRLLDMMDLAVFDFLTGNLDRHHYYTFKRFDNDTYPILTDNGRGFGRPRKDDIELLAPIYQCCLIRASTLEKIVKFASATGTDHHGNHMSLSQAISRSLKNDVIDNVLNAGHLAALDRRIRTVAIIVHDCLNRTLTAVGRVDKTRLDVDVIKRIVVDDGF